MTESASVVTRPPRWVTGLAIVCVVAGCGRGATDEAIIDHPRPYGVTGVTVVDVGCPTLTTTTPSCPNRPIPAHLRFSRPDSAAPIVELRTREDGTFTVELTPGRYQLLPTNLSGAPLPSAEPLTVEVAEGRFTEITVQFDSGVR